MKLYFSLLLAAVGPSVAGATGPEFAMTLAGEGRYFNQSPAYALQKDGSFSVHATPELHYHWSDYGHAKFVAFGRWDDSDSERSHADIRELAVQQRLGNFSLSAGIDRVFWGVTESVHLVDIINQTDLVENPDGEDKLGQPMINLAWHSPLGTLSAFVLPYFRERTLPGPEGRLRASLPYDHGDAIYESADKEQHIDSAVRWGLSQGPLEIGLSHFSGTNRTPGFTPRLVMAVPVPLPVALTPVYELIEQAGLDVNVVRGDWSWKLEAIHQRNRTEDFTAAAGGFEYTFTGVFGSVWDAGVLTEYLWDGRGANSPSPFQKDIFLGTRLSANNAASFEVLAGVIVDSDRGAVFGNIEAGRRMGEAGKLALELRFFEKTVSTDALDVFRQDDYLALEYSHYF